MVLNVGAAMHLESSDTKCSGSLADSMEFTSLAGTIEFTSLAGTMEFTSLAGTMEFTSLRTLWSLLA